MKGEDDDGKENRRIPFLDERERSIAAILSLSIAILHSPTTRPSEHTHTVTLNQSQAHKKVPFDIS